MRPAPIFPRSLLPQYAAGLSRITATQFVRRNGNAAVIFAKAFEQIMATLFVAS
jgi:hypothetical protein